MSKEPIRIVPPTRYHMPDTRPSITHKRVICGHKCYFTVAFFDDHEEDRYKPAEVFVQIAKQGSMIAGLMDGMATMISVALQYGIPWEVVREKLAHHKFGNEANDTEHTSLYDGLAKAVDHLIEERKSIIGASERPHKVARKVPYVEHQLNVTPDQLRAPFTGKHGGPLVRSFRAGWVDGNFSTYVRMYIYEDGSEYMVAEDPKAFVNGIIKQYGDEEPITFAGFINTDKPRQYTEIK